MLLRLQIENLALIDSLDLTLGRGLNVLTGETGAGKSIILDALDLVLGGKVNRRVIRTGAKRARVEATFAVEPEGTIQCSRELTASKRSCRSKYRLDGKIVSQKQIQQLRDRLVEIAAQGQAVQLARPNHQRQLLDLYGGEKLLAARREVEAAYDRLSAAERRLAERHALEEARSQQLDLWTYQLEDLHRAQLTHADELDDLEREAQRLSHVVELQQQSYRVYQALYENESEDAAADRLGDAETVLEDMVRYDDGLSPILNLVSEALVRVQEAGQQINAYASDLEADPERLQFVGERLRQLKQICRKYGPTLGDAIARQQDLERQLDELQGGENTYEDLEKRCQERRRVLQAACDRLSQLRADAAARLEARLVAALQPLAMDNVKFKVDLWPVTPNRSGGDRIGFWLSANPGEPLQPLGDVASGGEMSRFLLALKACFSEVDPVGTLVFDEIDVGVSGRVASTIAETLYHLSHRQQVLCVTHQPLVAAMADHHFHVAKHAVTDDENARTVVSVRSLAPDDRRQELAQLAVGQPDGSLEASQTSDAATAFADALLDRARRLRQPKTPSSDEVGAR